MGDRVEVQVWLKAAVLDPQGQAVMNALTREGLVGLSSVRQGKVFALEFASEFSISPQKQHELIEKLSAELLANPVIEDFAIVWPDKPGVTHVKDHSDQDSANALVIDELEGDA